MITFLKIIIINKHDFIMFNKDDCKWFSNNLKPINSGMGLNEQQSYLEAKTKAYKVEMAKRITINDLQHFSSALLQRISEIFKPLTTIKNKSLQQEKEIVTQLKNDHRTMSKRSIIDPLKAIANKPGNVKTIEAKN